jgi:hypothetical protein
MASWTSVYMHRRKMKAKKMGRARKSKIAKVGSTPSKAAFFGDTAKK